MGIVVLVSADLMFWAQLKAAASRAGVAVERVEDETGLEAALSRGGVSKVLVDLEAKGIASLASVARWKSSADPPWFIGFGSHVDRERLQAAAGAGFDEVMPRSRFHREIPALLERR